MKNKISMSGRIDPCWLFCYRAPLGQVQGLLPTELTAIDKGGFGFLNVVVCRVNRLRPASFSLAPGLRYWHIAYRVYVKAGGQEGLFFLRSDADNRLVCSAGNVLTAFNFHHATIKFSGRQIDVKSEGASAEVGVSSSEMTGLLPGSPFESLQEAAEFLKYKPAAIIPGEPTSVLRITRDEAAWQSRLVQVERARFEYLERLGFDIDLELAYEVEPIDYIWNRAEVLA